MEMFVKIDDVVYNTAGIRWIRFDPDDHEWGYICIGYDPKKDSRKETPNIEVQVELPRLEKLMKELADRNLVIDLKPPS